MLFIKFVAELLPLQLLQFQIGADLGFGLAEPQPQALQAGAREHLHIEAVAEANQLAHVEAQQTLGGAVGQGKAEPRHQWAGPDRTPGAGGCRRRAGSGLGHLHGAWGARL